MRRETFNKQLFRLKTQWPRSYGDERIKILWDSFKNVNDELFEQVITRLISDLRISPMVTEIKKEIDKINKDKAEQRIFHHYTNPFRMGIDSRIAVPNSDFARICLNIIRLKGEGKISLKTHLAVCDVLDIYADKTDKNGLREGIKKEVLRDSKFLSTHDLSMSDEELDNLLFT